MKNGILCQPQPINVTLSDVTCFHRVPFCGSIVVKHVGRFLTLRSPFEAAGLLLSTLIGLIKTLTVFSCLQVVFQGLLNQCIGQQPEVSLFQY